MGIKGIDHWVIVAGDLERTLAFYATLGFTVAWEDRPGRPRMATLRIGDAQKINVHGPDAPARPGYLGAGRPTVGGADFCLEWEGTVDEVAACVVFLASDEASYVTGANLNLSGGLFLDR